MAADIPASESSELGSREGKPPADLPHSRRRRVWILALLFLLCLLPAAGWGLHQHRVREEFRKAEAAFARYDLAAAATHLERYLGDRPNDAAAWFLAA